tara:strand:- start:806 stop:3454 length:2649 start_codon:yes stop_codon:yes gene_type:complete
MLKKSNKNILVLLILIFIIPLLYLLSNTSGFKTDLETSLRILLKQPTLFFGTKKIYENKFKDYSYKFLNGFKNRVFNNHSFENIKINISFSELEKLKKVREIALKKDKLSNTEYANIKIDFEGNSYRAKARLKGDLSKHYGSNKQWSLKIELKDKKSIFGMERFSISIFTQRDFPYNFVYYDLLSRYNLISPRFKIISVSFNGDDWGIMLLEEHFSSSFYAFNKIKETPIFRMTNEDGFKIITKSKKVKNGVKNLTDIVRWQGSFETKIYNNKEILKKTNIPNIRTNENLVNFFKKVQETSVIEDPKNSELLSNYLNIESFAKTMAITMLVGDGHSIQKTNSRYYINPYTSKIEPILTDISHTKLSDIEKNYVQKNYNYFYTSLFQNKKFINTYMETLLDIKKNFSLIDKKFKNICKKFGKNCFNQIEENLILDNLNYLISLEDKIFSQEINQTSIKQINYNTKNEFNLIKKKLFFRAFEDGTLKIINLTSEKIKIRKLSFKKDFSCKINCNIENNFKYILEPSTFDRPSMAVLKLDNKLNDIKFLEVFYTDEKGNKFSAIEKIEKNDFILTKFDGDYLIDKNNILFEDGDNLIIKKNKYVINYPIIVPASKNLIIEAGTILNMSKNAYIFVLDGNIQILGDRKNTISIKAKDNNPWKGIYVRSNEKSKSDSVIKNTHVSNFTYFDNSLVQLTGGINFYNSNVNIKDLIVKDAYSEDAINLVNCEYSIANTVVENSMSDAIDIDFSNGTLKASKFKNIGGDALDFSGSNSNIIKANIDNVKDKGISVGEESIVNLNNVKISNSVIGIASKDSSKVFGENIDVKNCIMHDYASFQKKSFFLGGSMTLVDSTGCNKELVQINSFLSLNGKIFKGKDIDINKEYY